MEALHEIGVKEPRQNFMVVSDGPLDQDGRPVIVVAKKSAFTADELNAVRDHLGSHSKLVSLYLPNGDNANNSFTQLISSNDPRAFAASYQYNVSPVFDSAPFFFFTLKTGSALADLRGTRGGMDWRVNLGILILGMVLLISVAAILLFLLVPLILEPRSTQPRILPLSYFVAIGLGYILIEITLIQRLVLFLGHPTYALTVVVFLMLLSSGAGSLCSRLGRTRMSSLWPLLTVIAAAVVIYLGLLPVVLRNFVGIAFGLKLVVSALLIVPLGFMMGVPFPRGLRLLSGASTGEGLTEWAWAMNASASVLGSVLAMVIAIHFGLNVTLMCGAVTYALAGLLASGLENRAPRKLHAGELSD
jgi:hypothetical protein